MYVGIEGKIKTIGVFVPSSAFLELGIICHNTSGVARFSQEY